MMPFALNKATEFINPTKTLEYMATGKPIVSTPVADVVRNFTPVVSVADGSEAYVAAVKRALKYPDEAMRKLGIERTQRASWESITRQMTSLMEDAIEARERRERKGTTRTTVPALTEQGARKAS